MSSLHPEGENVSRLCAGSTAYVFKIYTDAFIRKVKYLLRMCSAVYRVSVVWASIVRVTCRKGPGSG